MKILIVGVGKLGSQVAFLSILKFKPQLLILNDVKDLTGDILDLKNACKGLGIKTRITTKRSPSDVIIITAGVARNENIRTHKELLRLNTPIVKEIMNGLSKCIKPNTKIIVMTNPVDEMTELVRKMLPNNLVSSPEKILMKMRNNTELGWVIVSSKGYSNFGPAVSAILLLERIL